jgi:hypothetical protein
VRVRTNQSRARLQSVWVGNSRHHAQMYDKGVECNAAPAGRVRFEASMRPSRMTSVWAKDHGGQIKTAADLQPPILEQLLLASFTTLASGRR